MSAISFSNNYVSSNYYASAKTQHVASTETTNNCSDVVSPTGDVLTISAEALEALNNSGDALTLSVDELEGKEKIKIEILEKPKAQKISSLYRDIVENSAHFSLMDWAFSINSKSQNDYKYTTYSNKAQTEFANFRNLCSLESTNGTRNIYRLYTADKIQSELTNFRYQRSLENADETFAELLKKNGITLDEKEHIELKIDYDGKVTVSGNISQEKSELIQNTLNNDKSLGQNLLMAHINRNI